MAKSKELKRIEAKIREHRGNLFYYFRNLIDLIAFYKENFDDGSENEHCKSQIERLEKLIENDTNMFRTYSANIKSDLFDGWSGSGEYAQYLKQKESLTDNEKYLLKLF